MALYLVHMIVKNVIILVIHGPFKWEERKNDWRKGIYIYVLLKLYRDWKHPYIVYFPKKYTRHLL